MIKRFNYKICFSPLTIFFIFIFFAGCKKFEDQKINGSWFRVRMSLQEINHNDTTIWTFKDGKLFVYQNFTSLEDHRIFRDTNEYEVSRKKQFWNISFSKEMKSAIQTGKNYTIEKVNSQVLILNPVEPFQRIEFTKIK